MGVLKLSLTFAESHSLKEKRGVVKKIQGRVSHRFNISVTECGDQDLWQSAILGFSVVGSSHRIVEATLHRVIDFIDSMGLADIRGSDIEYFYC
ncbi:MAG: DUF503 domain-containing protein [Candidatus Binatia bacterium]